MTDWPEGAICEECHAEVIIAELQAALKDLGEWSRRELALAKATIAEGAANGVAQTHLIHELERQLREAKRRD